jgi:hypothetical protein
VRVPIGLRHVSAAAATERTLLACRSAFDAPFLVCRVTKTHHAHPVLRSCHGGLLQSESAWPVLLLPPTPSRHASAGASEIKRGLDVQRAQATSESPSAPWAPRRPRRRRRRRDKPKVPYPESPPPVPFPPSSVIR